MPSAIKSVAVVGAGVSGIVAAAHLRREGLEVIIFERCSAAGGIWYYDERKPLEPVYPSLPPSQLHRTYTPGVEKDLHSERLFHALPGPCYKGLKNNVGTQLLETTLNEFPVGTKDFVTHEVLKDYLQDTSVKTGVHDITHYNTEVREIKKEGQKWMVETLTLLNDKAGKVSWEVAVVKFDAVVVASGHYNAAKIPNTPGLAHWKRNLPDRIQHSKSYRTPKFFQDQNVLLIGGAVSATDIARELGPVAKNIYQSQRKGIFDLPASLLPENARRVDEVVSYDRVPSNESSRLLEAYEPIPATVTLKSGQKLCDIHHVILCTGYLITLPFLSHLHSDETPVDKANDTVLVTDGSQFHNLHKDIFYINDPSLTFVGVPFFTATFTLFEFQAMVVAKVLSGQAKLPSTQAMRAEYEERVKEKGHGKEFHSLKNREVEYVDELLAWVNKDLEEIGGGKVAGHTEKWHTANKERIEKIRVIFGAPPRPEKEVEVTCR